MFAIKTTGKFILVPQGPTKSSRAPQDRPKHPQEGPRPPPKTTQEPPRSPLGTVLELSWDHQTTRSKTRPIFYQISFGFGVDFGSQNDPPNDPKSTSTRVKIQDKKCITFLSLLELSWTGLEAVLGPSLGHFWPFRIGFFQYLLNIVIFEQMTVQDAFLAQLDPIWAPKRVPRGSQEAPKTSPKRTQDESKIESKIEVRK